MPLERHPTLSTTNTSARAACASEEIIIRGITTSGRKFRPSDWAERLAGLLSTFDLNCRVGYSPLVQPVLINGIMSVIVNRQLQEVDVRTYEFILGFGRDNDLVIEDWYVLPVAA